MVLTKFHVNIGVKIGIMKSRNLTPVALKIGPSAQCHNEKEYGILISTKHRT